MAQCGPKSDDQNTKFSDLECPVSEMNTPFFVYTWPSSHLSIYIFPSILNLNIYPIFLQSPEHDRKKTFTFFFFTSKKEKWNFLPFRWTFLEFSLIKIAFNFQSSMFIPCRNLLSEGGTEGSRRREEIRKEISGKSQHHESWEGELSVFIFTFCEIGKYGETQKGPDSLTRLKLKSIKRCFLVTCLLGNNEKSIDCILNFS